jgi:hypothetical protein
MHTSFNESKVSRLITWQQLTCTSFIPASWSQASPAYASSHVLLALCAHERSMGGGATFHLYSTTLDTYHCSLLPKPHLLMLVAMYCWHFVHTRGQWGVGLLFIYIAQPLTHMIVDTHHCSLVPKPHLLMLVAMYCWYFVYMRSMGGGATFHLYSTTLDTYHCRHTSL